MRVPEPGQEPGHSEPRPVAVPARRRDGARGLAVPHLRGLAPLIITTGGINRHTGIIEGREFRKALTRPGVPDEAIRVEDQSANTWQNAQLAQPYVREALAAELPLTAICTWYHRRAIHDPVGLLGSGGGSERRRGDQAGPFELTGAMFRDHDPGHDHGNLRRSGHGQCSVIMRAAMITETSLAGLRRTTSPPGTTGTTRLHCLRFARQPNLQLTNRIIHILKP